LETNTFTDSYYNQVRTLKSKEQYLSAYIEPFQFISSKRSLTGLRVILYFY